MNPSDTPAPLIQLSLVLSVCLTCFSFLCYWFTQAICLLNTPTVFSWKLFLLSFFNGLSLTGVLPARGQWYPQLLATSSQPPHSLLVFIKKSKDNFPRGKKLFCFEAELCCFRWESWTYFVRHNTNQYFCEQLTIRGSTNYFRAGSLTRAAATT